MFNVTGRYQSGGTLVPIHACCSIQIWLTSVHCLLQHHMQTIGPLLSYQNVHPITLFLLNADFLIFPMQFHLMVFN